MPKISRRGVRFLLAAVIAFSGAAAAHVAKGSAQTGNLAGSSVTIETTGAPGTATETGDDSWPWD